MKNLNEMQSFLAQLVKDLDYNVDKAKEVYGFIVNEPGVLNLDAVSEQPDQWYKPSVIQVNPPLDGIYFIMPDKTMIHTTNATDEEKRNSIAVGVRMGNKFANVVLHDAADGQKIALVSKDGSNPERFRQNFWDAISDWDGVGNTQAMRDFLNPEIGLEDGMYIPSVGELHLILLNIKEVNKALVEAGGDEIQDEWYWSSTENSSTIAWTVYFHSGYTTSINKCNYFTVRPSVAV